MADAERDQNRVATLLGVSSSDGVTPLKAEITAATGRLRVDSLLTAGTAIAGKVYITDGTDDADVVQIVDSTTNLDSTKGLVTNSVLYGRVDDTKFLPLKVDPVTQSLQTVEYAHHEIHSGSHYFVYINKDVAIAGTYNVCFTTPNTTTWAHMTITVQSEVEADVILYEGITSFTGGTAITPLNNNRNSANNSGITDMAFDATPTVGTPTTLAHSVIGSGRASGGGARSEQEFILKQNTKYYLLVTNQTAGATNEVNIALLWYEHANAN